MVAATEVSLTGLCAGQTIRCDAPAQPVHTVGRCKILGIGKPAHGLTSSQLDADYSPHFLALVADERPGRIFVAELDDVCAGRDRDKPIL